MFTTAAAAAVVVAVVVVIVVVVVVVVVVVCLFACNVNYKNHTMAHTQDWFTNHKASRQNY